MEQDREDRAFWARIAEMFGTTLYGWSYRDHASFINPQMEVWGKVAAKLIEQDDEIARLRSLLRYTIHTAADMAAMDMEEWAEERLREVDNA